MRERLINLRLLYCGFLAKKRRLFFSVLGILIGVAALIAMISIGEGSKAKLEEEFESFGLNNLIVFAGKAGVRGGRAMIMEIMPTLKLEDADAIRKIYGVVNVSPMYDLVANVESNKGKAQKSVIGAMPSYFIIRKYSLYSGRLFTEREVKRADLVAVIGWKVMNDVFEGKVPVGERLRIFRMPFKVIGVLAPKGTDATGRDLDDVVVVPITVATKRLDNVDYIKAIEVECKDKSYVGIVETAIDKVLKEKHRIKFNESKDFTIIKAEEVIKQKEQSTNLFSMLIGAVSLISLVVGTFGVSATMILSVRERFKEIGIRKAIGATHFDIMLSFLVESVAVTFIGGIFGVVVGIFVSFVANKTMQNPFVFPYKAILIAFFTIALFGILAGLYPAYKASKVDPIDVIRS